jgi:hypothetical protein
MYELRIKHFVKTKRLKHKYYLNINALKRAAALKALIATILTAIKFKKIN